MNILILMDGSMSNKLEKIPNELIMLFMLMVANVLSILFYKSVGVEVPNNLINSTFSVIDRFRKSYDRMFTLMFE